MTSQTSKNTGWRHAVTGVMTSVALAACFFAGIGSAYAEPAAPTDPTTETDAPPAMTADQALAIIATEYDTGAGGGKLSNLIHQVMTLRSQGFYPSKGNKQAIEDALGKRPNQGPLVEALNETLAFQLKEKARSQMSQQQAPMTIGINQYDPNNPSAVGGFGITPGGAGPDGGISIPLAP